MEKTVQHRFLNSPIFTALAVPLMFFVLRDTIAALTEPMFRSLGGEDSFLCLINEDIARLIIAALLIAIMPIFFRGSCNFGFRGGKIKLGLLLALPELIVPVWNLLQIKIYGAPLVTGTAAVLAAIVHGIGPGVSEEVFCRGFVVSNLMRVWREKPDRILRCTLASGVAFGLLHSVNVIVTGDILATLVQVIYTAAMGILSGAIYLRSRSLWGVILMHTLTDISAFIAVFESAEATGMDILFCAVGSVVFIALAFYLIRPAKRGEIDELWAEGWSFGDEGRHAGAKAAAIVSAVLAAAFVVSLGVIVYRAKMGYDTPLFPAAEKPLDAEVQYQISGDGRELTVLLPYGGGEVYELENSDPAALVLRESGAEGGSYLFAFTHEGNGTEKAELKFAKKFGNMPVSMKDYTVTVSFHPDGTISEVNG